MIRTKEYCDICEQKHGEGSEKALIVKPPGKPAFAQLIWTYFKKGKQILKNPGTMEPTISEQWLGAPNRLEFCDQHASEFNVLMKALCSRDSDLVKIIEKLKTRDDQEWATKQQAKVEEFNAIYKVWKRRAKK